MKETRKIILAGAAALGAVFAVLMFGGYALDMWMIFVPVFAGVFVLSHVQGAKLRLPGGVIAPLAAAVIYGAAVWLENLILNYAGYAIEDYDALVLLYAIVEGVLMCAAFTVGLLAACRRGLEKGAFVMPKGKRLLAGIFAVVMAMLFVVLLHKAKYAARPSYMDSPLSSIATYFTHSSSTLWTLADAVILCALTVCWTALAKAQYDEIQSGQEEGAEPPEEQETAEEMLRPEKADESEE